MVKSLDDLHEMINNDINKIEIVFISFNIVLNFIKLILTNQSDFTTSLICSAILSICHASIVNAGAILTGEW